MRFLGIEWTTKRHDQMTLQDGLIYGVTYFQNPDFGQFFIEEDLERVIGWADQDFELRCLIMEIQLTGKTCFLVSAVNLDKFQALYRDSTAYTFVAYEELIKTFPKTLEEKVDRILKNLRNVSTGYGSVITRLSWPMFFSRNLEELRFLLTTLETRGLVSGTFNMTGTELTMVSQEFRLTPEAWTILESTPSGKRSQNIFVAMKFDPSTDPAYIAISAAIEQLGFKPVRVDKLEHNTWITGKILEEIKQSAGMVADVTGQRNGVYFEAGYAMGLGLPVIFACQKAEFDAGQVHFDTKQLNHVLWENTDELEAKLASRIEATILTR